MSSSADLDLSQCVTLACLLEVAAPKPGNVHRGADFEELTLQDFLVSAVIVGRALTGPGPVGERVLSAVLTTRDMVGTNTNLGMVLLLAPLVSVPRGESLAEGLPKVLLDLDASDARNLYQAINSAQAGGLNKVPEMDLHEAPPDSILDAMRAAADRDLIARQYTNNFAEVLTEVAPALQRNREQLPGLTAAILVTHLETLAKHPDSLIARKCGTDVAAEASSRAAHVLAAGAYGTPDFLQAMTDLDFWLRSDEHRRNPGTTADLIAAALFVLLRNRQIRPPYR